MAVKYFPRPINEMRGEGDVMSLTSRKELPSRMPVMSREMFSTLYVPSFSSSRVLHVYYDFLFDVPSLQIGWDSWLGVWRPLSAYTSHAQSCH